MNISNVAALRERFSRYGFSRAPTYDPQWLFDNAMAGPPAICLAEWLTGRMKLEPGMRVLDLGCGRAVSSVFLAREFGVTVWAAGLWIKPTENHALIEAAGLSAKVFPVHAEAHALPFAHEYFDAVVCLDAYHYFGTDDLYLGTISKFLRRGGQFGIVVPGIAAEPQVTSGQYPPPHLAPWWNWEFVPFHARDWWRRHWEKTGLVTIEIADSLPDGWKLWLDRNEMLAQHGPATLHSLVLPEIDLLRVDDGRTFDLVRVVARKR
jgi:cyclopropane fatty-acyl-phospholipid synthase-like methyltransferase